MRDLELEASPHLWGGRGVRWVMGEVILALLPAALGGVFLFGAGALRVLLGSLAGSLIGEAALQGLLGRRVRVSDLSAVVTGLLLGLSLPPRLPWWVGFIGGLFATAVVKEFFGGLGQNFLNPALAARAFLLASWPDLLSRFPRPFDGVGAASPLAGGHFAWSKLFWGAVPGSVGETFHPGIVLGGIYLALQGVIDLAAPFGFLGALGLGGLLGGTGFFTPWLEGGALLAAFFMTTDYPTTPLTRTGRLIFGIGAGAVTAFIRRVGPLPEGVTYGILLMNLFTPLIDRWVRPGGV